MKIEVDIPDLIVETFARGLMENYPEYSQGSALKCVSHRYKEGKFVFLDIEQRNKEYTVTTKDICDAIPVFIDGVIKNKWKFDGLDIRNILNLDATDYDAYSTDAIVQLAIFKQIIYG